MDATKTGHFIREQRKRLGLSQLKLAEMLYVEPQTISKWERGLGMPDYDNVERLKEIFGCSLSDILEPTDTDDDLVEIEASDEDKSTNLPVLVRVLNDDKSEKKKRFSLLDFINKKKIKETVGRIFGYEYESAYNEKFLFKDVRKKRSRDDFENTITQGMFKGKANHTVLGIEAPWLYMRVFFFMLICTAISLACTILTGYPMAFIIVGGLCAVVPLMVFLFETNYARNLTILDVGKMFLIGGLSSLVLTMILNLPFNAGEVASAVLLAPLLEELAKAIIVIFFVAKIKPKNMLTGLLIGFSIGAGFDAFESFDYAFKSYLIEFFFSEGDYLTATGSSIGTIILRTFWSFFSGHHYFTAIFGAIYVLFKKEVTFKFKDLCQWKVLCGYIIPVLLHMIWNASAFIEASFVALLIEALICVACVLSLTFLINIGINQTRVMEIYENYQVPSQAEETIYTTVE